MKQLDIIEQNKLKAICAQPIPKATESEWKLMKVMLPIVKNGVGAVRAGVEDSMFGAESLSSRRISDIWTQRHNL